MVAHSGLLPDSLGSVTPPRSAAAPYGDPMRVYLPGTLPALATVLGRTDVGEPPLRGFAVTPALREWYSSGDLEELEYVAMAQAARASLRRLAEDPDAPPRRVVLAVEVPDERVKAVSGSADPAAVEVSG